MKWEKKKPICQFIYFDDIERILSLKQHKRHQWNSTTTNLQHHIPLFFFYTLNHSNVPPKSHESHTHTFFLISLQQPIKNNHFFHQSKSRIFTREYTRFVNLTSHLLLLKFEEQTVRSWENLYNSWRIFKIFLSFFFLGEFICSHQLGDSCWILCYKKISTRLSPTIL